MTEREEKSVSECAVKVDAEGNNLILLSDSTFLEVGVRMLRATPVTASRDGTLVHLCSHTCGLYLPLG